MKRLANGAYTTTCIRLQPLYYSLLTRQAQELGVSVAVLLNASVLHGMQAAYDYLKPRKVKHD